MNKYQEAYNIIDGYVLFHGLAEEDERYKELIKALGMLNELVDKATPKKPIKSEEQDIRYVTKYECPNCHQYFTRRISKYCYHCGQALKWEEEE